MRITWVKDGECMRCTSHKPNVYGYPRLQIKRKHWPIARWIIHRRFAESLTQDIVSRHTCDNRWCINPSHIISGSHADNMRDRNLRGRQTRGLNHWCCKLNPDLVKEIRSLKGKISVKKIAKKFGMGKTPIDKVLKGLTWKHV